MHTLVTIKINRKSGFHFDVLSIRYLFIILISLLLTAATVTAHPAVRSMNPGEAAIHQAKFIQLHLPSRSGHLNRFVLNHNSMIVGFSKSPGGNGNPYAMAINSRGIVHASSVIRQNGKILLKSDSKETAFDAIHSQAWINTYDQNYTAALAAKHQENHDNQYNAENALVYNYRLQAAHQRRHDTVKRNAKIYYRENQYSYSDPYIEVYDDPTYYEYSY